MTATIVLPQSIFDEIRAASAFPLETAGVLIVGLARPVRDGSRGASIRLLARKMRWVDDKSYLERSDTHLKIASEGYVPALSEAESLGGACMWIHTHPGQSSSPRPSGADAVVDSQLTDLFRLRSGSPYYGALVFSPRPNGVAFCGHIKHEGHEAIAVSRLWQVGGRWGLTSSIDASRESVPHIFERQVQAFGAPIQAVLNKLRVGIVGCGGTGSAVAEQLIRLGVREITLIDADRLSASNVTRVYGSTPDDVGAAKVAVLSRHLKRIAPDVQVAAIEAMVTSEPAARQLVGSDVVFGCTDDNAGRLILSRLSAYYLIPIIDCGVLLSSSPTGELAGIDGRVTTMTAGEACLVCRGRIDLSRAAAELMSPDERKRREDEGYAPALGRNEPSVVTFTTMVAATAVTELLERLIGFGPGERPGEVLIRAHEREISTNKSAPRERHYCHPKGGKLGRGDVEPFLDQVWSQ